MGDSEQQLFLAEFLVDRVNIPSIRAMHTEMLPVTTCVSFQILSLPPINIYQETCAENCTCDDGDTQIFKKGKSCLFALPSVVLEKPLGTFPINMSVYKKLPPGVLPDVMSIGSHQIEAKNLINEMLSLHLFKSGNPCKTMKDTFKLTTPTGQRVGEVTVFIRMSCFGPKIVTQFQIPHNQKPYLFKGAENSPVFQCKRIPSECSDVDGEATTTTTMMKGAMRCSCEPIARSADRRDEKGTIRKTCCQLPAAPPPRPSTRQLPTSHDAGRPCCPSARGEQCPSIPKSAMKSHRDRAKYSHQESSDNCCC